MHACRAPPPAHVADARARLQSLISSPAVGGLGDHVLLLRLWEGWRAAGFSKAYCNEHGLELRGMNFAKDIHRQLTGKLLRARACGTVRAAVRAAVHGAMRGAMRCVPAVSACLLPQTTALGL